MTVRAIGDPRARWTHDDSLPTAVHSQADLEEAWRHLIRPLGFHRRSVWLMLIDAEGRPTPVVTEVTDLPEVVDLETTQGLGEMLAQLLEHVDPQVAGPFS